MQSIFEEFGNTIIEVVLMMTMIKILFWILAVIEALPA